MNLNKEEKKKVKRFLKNHILHRLFGNLEGSRVVYNQVTGHWDIDVQVAFKIPSGFETVAKGMEEDLFQEGIQEFLKIQSNNLNDKLKECFNSSLKDIGSDDANLTYIFPPSFIARREGDYYRLLTEEESNVIIKDAPSLEGLIKREFQLLEEGYYEFIPNTPIEEYDIYAFRLKKYSSLRARYSFSVSHENVEDFKIEDVELVFQAKESA